jgi:hypothetical protein
MIEHVCRMMKKSCNPFHTYILFVKKISYIEIRKQRQCCSKCWKCPSHSVMCAFTVFLTFYATQQRVPAVMEVVHQTGHFRFIYYGRMGKCVSKTYSGKLIKGKMPGSVRH